ncbi:MAG: sulfotransferase [Thermoanaerobaculia bacterium]|nr:sulfotransferase [Thermoanaerobaculia bacterium]
MPEPPGEAAGRSPLASSHTWPASIRRPDFLLIGAAKSGTTALYRQLGQHPAVFLPHLKEANFFGLPAHGARFHGPNDDEGINRRSIVDAREYSSLFRPAADAVAVGEASTLYLCSERAARRIWEFDPGMRILAVLRDPVERAFSAYRHLVRDGHETLPFEEALDREAERLSAGWSHIWHYAGAGFYAGQLRRYYELFPRQQILVLTYDEYVDRPDRCLHRIFEFLGVDPSFVPDLGRRYNVSGAPRSTLLHRLAVRPSLLKRTLRPLLPRSVRASILRVAHGWNIRARPVEIPPRARRRLSALYRTEIRDLEELTGLELAAWR